MSDDELLRAVTNARALKTQAEEQVALELQRRKWSFRAIGAALDLNEKTIRLWVRRAGGDADGDADGDAEEPGVAPSTGAPGAAEDHPDGASRSGDSPE